VAKLFDLTLAVILIPAEFGREQVGDDLCGGK
jgi:hypothetical protein